MTKVWEPGIRLDTEYCQQMFFPRAPAQLFMIRPFTELLKEKNLYSIISARECLFSVSRRRISLAQICYFLEIGLPFFSELCVDG